MSRTKIIVIIFIYSICYSIILWIYYNIIITESFYFSSFESFLSMKKIEEIIKFNKKFEWLSYVLLPLFNIFKYTLVSIVIFIGVKLFEIDLNFRDCFKITLLAELVSIISSISRTLYLYIYPPMNYEYLQNFNPLGLSTFLNLNSISKFLIYPLQQLNLFEMLYWLLLAYGIKMHGGINYKKALQITSLSYGVGLLIWCIFIVFIQLQFS